MEFQVTDYFLNQICKLAKWSKRISKYNFQRLALLLFARKLKIIFCTLNPHTDTMKEINQQVQICQMMLSISCTWVFKWWKTIFKYKPLVNDKPMIHSFTKNLETIFITKKQLISLKPYSWNICSWKFKTKI